MTEKQNSHPRQQRWLLFLILGLYLLLALGYGILNPLFEAPDEHWHYFTAQFIADTQTLPVVTADYDEWLSQEAAQPPLYYVLSALLIAPVDAQNGRSQSWHNPFATIGNAAFRTNINRFVHTDAEAWPWQDFALAAHLLRLFSTLLGLGTLLCIYGSARLIWPQRPHIPLLAIALVAFLPQFAFLHGSISNDTLIIFLASLALWQLLHLWIDGTSNGRILFLGTIIGLAILSKTAGILLLLYSCGVLFLLWLKNIEAVKENLPDFTGKSPYVGAWRRHAPTRTSSYPARSRRAEKNLHTVRIKPLITNLLLLLAPALLIGGWLWLRNWQLYNDITATEPFIRIAGGSRAYTLWQVLSESGGLWSSLFAIFGWFNLRPPAWVFWLWNGIVLTAIIGFVTGLRNWKPHFKSTPTIPSLLSMLQQRWFIAVLLAIWVVGVYAGLVAFMMRTEAAQGRLLFPAILPLALALAYGLGSFRQPIVYITAALLALLTTVYCLFFVVAPAYTPPRAVADLPQTAVSIGTRLNDSLQLAGAAINTTTAVPDDYLTVTLYWQNLQPPAAPAEFILETIGRDGERIANIHSYHGRGLYPNTLWTQGAVIADQFSVRVEKTAAAPVLAPIFVGLANANERIRIGEVKVVPSTWPTAAAPPLAQIGDGIWLTHVQLSSSTAQPGDTINIHVQWQVKNAPATDYTTLIHLGEPGQPPLATADNQPLAGQYPTRVWAAGEVINDVYTLTIPADLPNGRYPLWLGMYNAADPAFTRLPLTIDGQRQPHDTYLITTIEVQQ